MILKLPFSARPALFCVGVYVFISMMYIAQGIILPLIFGVILAILIHPVVRLFVRWKFNRVIAIIVTLLLSFSVIVAFALFMFSQLSQFTDTWPVFIDKFTNLIDQTIQWIPRYSGISAEKVNSWIAETKIDVLNSSSAYIGQSLLTVGSSVVALFLIPVYVFLILFYKPLLLDFIHRLFDDKRQSKVTVIITQTKSVIQQYLVGLFIEALLVAVLNSVGLLILGIDYAILIGILGAILNFIPYIGGIVGVAMPMMIALVTKESAWSAMYVMAIYYFIQLIDNNYIVPKIVASKVRINALVSIVVVLAGGAIWGVSGMFLSIPLIAIVKVICDHIEPLKPYGLLLGDTMPVIGIFNIKKITKTHQK